MPSFDNEVVSICCILNSDENARVAPANVPKDAITNEPSNEPHWRSASPRRLVPSNSNGVANVSATDCRKVDAGDPPGGSRGIHLQVDGYDSDGKQLILDKTKVIAIADTGAPKSFPTNVVFPNS